MGDPRAGSTGTTATTVPAPAPPSAAARPAVGKRVARHAAEQCPSHPYTGRRVAQVLPVPLEVAKRAEGLAYAGRCVAVVPELQGEEDLAGHLLEPAPA